MSSAARSLFVFGVYLIVAGALFVTIPNLVLPLLAVPTTSEVYIRVVGTLLVLIGVFDLVAARHELTPLIRWSIPLRASVTLFFGAFVLLGLGTPSLLISSSIDMAGALWTALALRKDR